MRPTSPIVALAVLTASSACEEPFELDDGGLIAHVVIDAQLEAGAAPLVGIRTVDVFGNPAAGAPVAESFVTLENSDGRTFELPLAPQTPPSDSLALFTALDEVIVAGLSYRLRVETPGFSRVVSETTVPAVATLQFAAERDDSLSYEPVTYDTAYDQLSVGFLVDAPGPGTEHYHILVTALGESGASRLPVIFARNVSGSRDLGSAGVLLSGSAFAGGRIDNRILLDRGRLAAANAHSVELEVRSVTRAYYEALAEADVVDSSPLGPLPGGADRPVGNIAGGRGLFTSYSTVRRALELDR